MSADDYINPEELIEHYAQAGAFEELAELASKDPTPQIQKKILEVLKEKAPHLGRETAEELIKNEETDSDVKELAGEILGGGREAEKAVSTKWNPHSIALWREVEEQLKILEVNTRMMGKLKARKMEKAEEKERMMKEAALLLAHINTGAKPNTKAYELFSRLLTDKDILERVKRDLLLYLPMMVKTSTKEQKDIMFSAACFLVENGDEIGAGNRLRVCAVLTLGKMVDALTRIREKMGGIPEKDKVFHKPAKHENPFVHGALKTAKVTVKG